MAAMFPRPHYVKTFIIRFIRILLNDTIHKETVTLPLLYQLRDFVHANYALRYTNVANQDNDVISPCILPLQVGTQATSH